MSFDKFAWIKVLVADVRFTEKERLVGTVVCVWFTRADGTGWAVKLDDVADRVGGMSHNRLAVALKRLVDYGYLQETSRSLGGRGLKASRSHNLSIPQPAPVGVNGKPHPAAVGVLTETPTGRAQNPNQRRAKPQPAAVTETASDLPGEPPTGTSSGTSSGTASVDERTDEFESVPAWATPPPKCAKHPDGWDHDEGCRKCERLRKWDENPDQRREQNYKAAWGEFHRLDAQARNGMHGDWRPERPPRFHSEFSSTVPWRQPIPPPSVCADAIGQW